MHAKKGLMEEEEKEGECECREDVSGEACTVCATTYNGIIAGTHEKKWGL